MKNFTIIHTQPTAKSTEPLSLIAQKTRYCDDKRNRSPACISTSRSLMYSPITITCSNVDHFCSHWPSYQDWRSHEQFWLLIYWMLTVFNKKKSNTVLLFFRPANLLAVCQVQFVQQFRQRNFKSEYSIFKISPRRFSAQSHCTLHPCQV